MSGRFQSRKSDEDDQANELYETIGSRVLEWWDTCPDEPPTASAVFVAPHIQRLQKSLSTPITRLPSSWKSDIATITAAMSSDEFGVYGKKLTRFFFQVRALQYGAVQPSRPRTTTSAPQIEAYRRSFGARKPAPLAVPDSNPMRHSYRPFPVWLPTNRETDDV
jgi:hypothetical protein